MRHPPEPNPGKNPPSDEAKPPEAPTPEPPATPPPPAEKVEPAVPPPAEPPLPQEGLPPEPKLSGFEKVDPAKIVQLKPPVRRPFWTGTMPGSPYQNLTFFGIDFVAFEGRVSFGVDGQAEGRLDRGKIHYLTVDQVAGIKASVAHAVIRGAGEVSTKLDVRTRGFQNLPGDMPIGRYVFMVPVHPQMPFGWRDAEPEPMVD